MTAWSAGVLTGELSADYSQVELHPGDGGHVFGMGDIGLANGGLGGSPILTTARQYGSIRLTVQVLDEEPALDSSWDAVVEFSLHTGASVSVTGWAGEGVIAVPLPSAVDVRVRYAVLDGQVAQDQSVEDHTAEGGVGPERYLVQIWPGTQAPPRVVASSSPWSQYWTFGGPATALLAELAGVPDPDKLVVVIDRALAAHPDVAGRLRAGDVRYRVGVIRYLQELFRTSYDTGAYDDVRDDHERLGRLIDERARLRDRETEDQTAEEKIVMTSAMRFDEATSRRVERTYMTPDVVEQRKVARALLGLAPGEHVLDIGCGPGFLAEEMAEAVGPAGSVHGIDPSPPMLAIAGARSAAAPLTFGPGEATALPLADASADVVTATQVYEYVRDMTAALAEVRRVLRPGGRVLVLDTDWDSIVWHSSDPERMRRVLAAWDEHLADPHLPRRLGGLLREAGFTVAHASVLPLLNIGYREDTFSAGVIGFVTAFVPGHRGITAEDAEAWADDLRRLGDDYFFSLNRYLFLGIKTPA